jgi:hypothetical protein
MSATAAPTRTPTPPPGPAPRGPGGRALLVIGVVVGVALVVATGWSAVQALAEGWGNAPTTSGTSTYTAQPTVELHADGDVSVTKGGDRVVVRRTAHSAIGSVRYSAQVEGDHLVVRHTCWRFSGTCRASLDVTVPEGTALVITTSDGRLDAHGLVGSLEAHTADGAPTIANVRGDVTLSTGDGRVDVRDIDGSLTASTSDGAVAISGVTGDATVRTSDGRVDVEKVQGNVDASTSDGAVTVRGTGEPVALDISTSNGHQTVQAPTNPNASRHVRIHTSDGDVAYLGPR